MTDWRRAQRRAARTGKWAKIMTKWLIARTRTRTAWQIVDFVGPGGGESTGIVDILAIRKNHNNAGRGLKRGDLFDIIPIQVKGGAAPWPSLDDVKRLRRVGRLYRAKYVLLAEWKPGRQPALYRLQKRGVLSQDPRRAWTPISADQAFGLRPREASLWTPS